MDVQQINVLELFRIENVELYKTYKENGSLASAGPLQVLYSQDHDWFILKLDDFVYGLSKAIPVLSSHDERNSINYYVFINIDGYFIMKINGSNSQEDLENLENILRACTQFAYREGPEGHGLIVETSKGKVKVRKAVPQNNALSIGRGEADLARLIYRGGKAAKAFMLNSAEVISVGINKIGGFVEDTLVKKEEKGLKISPETINKFAQLNTITSTVTPMSTFYIKGVMLLAQKIAQILEGKAEEKKAANEAAHIAQLQAPMTVAQEQVGSLAEATFYSAINIWKGMIEALDIIRNAVTNASSKFVSSKYGPIAGQLFKAGVELAGNVAIPKVPGSSLLKYIKY